MSIAEEVGAAAVAEEVGIVGTTTAAEVKTFAIAEVEEYAVAEEVGPVGAVAVAEEAVGLVGAAAVAEEVSLLIAEDCQAIICASAARFWSYVCSICLYSSTVKSPQGLRPLNVRFAPSGVSAHCTRPPRSYGHLPAIFADFARAGSCLIAHAPARLAA